VSEKVVEVVARHTRAASTLTVVAIALRMAMPLAPEGAGRPIIAHALSVAILAGFTWVLVGLIESVEQYIVARYSIDTADNLRQRKIQTQSRVLVRATQIVVVILGSAAILMTFPAIRQFGASILASAGLAGLVIGLAARPVVANLIAGVQIALTQPIRIDDVVVMEGQWGRIEEITATYVVVRIWDERRLIVPLARIIEHPFENWTRTSASVLGTATVRADLGVPLDGLRAEMRRLCEADNRWDGRVCSMQVTGADDRSMEVRALVSAADSGRLWDLRCDVREGLLRYLLDHDAAALPHLRATVSRRTEPHPSEAAGESSGA
jgi:small-conductance mechanosensitive channel